MKEVWDTEKLNRKCNFKLSCRTEKRKRKSCWKTILCSPTNYRSHPGKVDMKNVYKSSNIFQLILQLLLGAFSSQSNLSLHEFIIWHCPWLVCTIDHSLISDFTSMPISESSPFTSGYIHHRCSVGAWTRAEGNSR